MAGGGGDACLQPHALGQRSPGAPSVRELAAAFVNVLLDGVGDLGPLRLASPEEEASGVVMVDAAEAVPATDLWGGIVTLLYLDSLPTW